MHTAAKARIIRTKNKEANKDSFKKLYIASLLVFLKRCKRKRSLQQNFF